jgi:hypothetical protein
VNNIEYDDYNRNDSEPFFNHTAYIFMFLFLVFFILPGLMIYYSKTDTPKDEIGDIILDKINEVGKNFTESIIPIQGTIEEVDINKENIINKGVVDNSEPTEPTVPTEPTESTIDIIATPPSEEENTPPPIINDEL